MNKVNFRLRSYGGFDSAQPPDIGRSRLRSRQASQPPGAFDLTLRNQ